MKPAICLFILATLAAGCQQNADMYVVARVQDPAVQIDGNLNEKAWTQAHALNDFSLPWEKTTPQRTTFRAFADEQNLYLSFAVEDVTLVMQGEFRSERTLDVEDRVEIFFSPTANLREYFCLEFDPLGRIHDYAAFIPRRFDSTWTCPGLLASGRLTKGGYIVEAAVPLATLRDLGLDVDSGKPVVVGLFRADLQYTWHGHPAHASQGRPAPASATTATSTTKTAGETPARHMGETPMPQQPYVEHWQAWIDPHVPRANFHTPTAFGRFVFAK